MEQNSMQAMQIRLKRLERRLQIFYVAGLSAVVLAIFFYAVSPAGSAQSDDTAKVIRARGLIIVDEQGRERILLGAPIPSAANRVRTNLARVKEIWGGNFPPKYMEWYRDYRHDANGLLILDENGFDRIAIGDPVPDPNIGKRSGNATGITINDDRGFERTGYAVFKEKVGYSVLLGLDNDQGREAVKLSVQDGAASGVAVETKNQSLFLGNAPSGSSATKLPTPFNGLLLRQGAEVKHQVNIAPPKVEKKP